MFEEDLSVSEIREQSCLSQTMTDGQCWWFLSVQDPESRQTDSMRSREVWG